MRPTSLKGGFETLVYKWLIFDADGTLFDFRRAEALALQMTPTQLGIDVPENFANTYHRINDALWQLFEKGEMEARNVRLQRFQRLFGNLHLEGDPTAFSEAFLKNLIRETRFLDGAQPLLETLKGCVSLALLTNGFADVQRARIARLGLQDTFQHVLISEELGVAKPGRAIFDIAFERMGQPGRAHVLIIGDSLSSDIRGGADYGIDTCWLNLDRRGNTSDIVPTYEIRDLQDVLRVLSPPGRDDGQSSSRST